MKNKLFDKDFYLEGLRQTKTAGILNSVIIFIGVFFSAFGFFVEYINTVMYSNNTFEESVGALLANPLVMTSFVIFTPILVMNLFSFLNKRNYSDFYHALPQRRETVAISYLAAIFTWLFIGVISSTLISAVVFSLIPGMTVEYAEFIPYAFNMCASCVIVAGAIIFAMSLTGKRISNFVMALLILFFPRLMITFVSVVLSVTVSIVPNQNLNFLEYNIPAGLLLFSSNFYLNDGLVNPISGLYTLTVGLAYIAIGICLFKIRPSETAGNSSTSRKIQAIFRMCFTQLFCFVPTGLLCSLVFGGDFDDWLYGIYAVLLMYVVSTVAYILFELITTRKGRNIIKSLPGLGIVGIANISIVALVVVYSTVAYNYAPSADSITSVSVTSLDYESDGFGILYYDYYDETDYFSDSISDIKITDTEVKNIVSNHLQKYKQDKSKKYDSEYFNDVTFKVRTAFDSKERFISLSDEEYETVIKALKKHPEALSVFINLPDRDVTIDYNYGLDDAQEERLYEILREELKTVDAEKWYDCVLVDEYVYYDYYSDKDYSSDDVTCYEHFNVSVTKGQKQYDLSLPITNLTPKTLRLYKEFTNQEYLKF